MIFDDTIFDFHCKSRTYDCVLDLLKRWQKYADIIIWTGKGEEHYENIRKYVGDLGIKIQGINCDSCVKVGGRKIYANVYLDDRSGLGETYNMLLKLLDKIEKGKIVYRQIKKKCVSKN